MASILKVIPSGDIDWQQIVFDITVGCNRDRKMVARDLGISVELLQQIANRTRGKQITYDTGIKLREAWFNAKVPKMLPPA